MERNGVMEDLLTEAKTAKSIENGSRRSAHDFA
jgi:hypothetical protein